MLNKTDKTKTTDEFKVNKINLSVLSDKELELLNELADKFTSA